MTSRTGAMFLTFARRCATSFQRNALVSLLPLVMPIIFLLLFLNATRDVGDPPRVRVGVVEAQVPASFAAALVETGLAKVDGIADPAAARTIDATDYDMTVVAGRTGALVVRIRPGFERWAGLLLRETARYRQGTAAGVPFQARIVTVPVRNDGYLSFIIPGLFVMVLIQLSMTSTAAVVLNDRADGTFRMVSNVRGAILPLVTAEVLFRFVFALLCFAFMMVAVNQAIGAWLADRMLLFCAVFALGAAMMISVGYTLGGLLPGRRNWTAVITLVGLAFWFFSDILFQASQHPLARPIALLLPPTYLTDALRQIATRRPGTFPVVVDLAMMTVVLAGSLALSLKFFRYETNDDRL